MSHYLPTSADEAYVHGGPTRTPYRWRHADDTARLAEVVTHYDIGMISWQYDDNSTWILQEETVPTWIKLSISAPSGGGTLNNLVKWTPDGYSLGDSNISDDGSLVEVAVDTTVDGTITANDSSFPLFAGGFTGASGLGGLGVSIGGNSNDPLVSFDVVDAAKSTLRCGVIHVNNSLGKLTINNGLTDLDLIVLSSSGAELIKVDSALGETSFVLGDAAGSRKIYVKDSSLVDVASIDSNGSAFLGKLLISYNGDSDQFDIEDLFNDSIFAVSGNRRPTLVFKESGATRSTIALETDGTLKSESITGYDIKLVTGNDIILELQDAAGANKISVKDSGSVEVASIDSDGNAQFASDLTVGGNATIGNGATGVDYKLTFDGETNDCTITWEQAQKRITVDQEIYEDERPLLRYAFMMGIN